MTVDIKRVPASVYIAFFAIFFLVVFNFSLTLMASPYIVSELGASKYMTVYTISFYSVGNALGVPIGRSFIHSIKSVHLLVVCLILFAFFSWICAVTLYFPVFIIGRFLQGLVGGPFYTLVNRFFAVLIPKDKQEYSTYALLTLLSITPILAATFGGWIAYDYHWRWLFYLNIPICVLLALVIGIQLRGYEIPSHPSAFDGVGYFFYFVGILALSTVSIVGQDLDWFRSPLINGLTVIGVISTLFFLLWSYLHPHPILNLRLLKNFGLSFALSSLALLYACYFATVILLGLWLNFYVDYTPIWIGLLIGIMALSALFPTFLIRKGIGRGDARIPIAIAVTFLAISCFHTSYFNVDIDFGRIAASRITAGLGLALFLTPIFRLCFRSVEASKGVDVMILFQFVRGISGGVGTALYIILWQRRQVFYHERLGSRLTAFSPETQQYFADAKLFHLEGTPAAAELDVLLEREATSLALDDCFYMIGWVMVAFLVLMLLTIFLRKETFFPEERVSLTE